MATQFKLCSFKTCPWVQRAAIVLRAKNVAYDITYINRDKRPDWFLAVSPHSKVPVLLVNDKEALFESSAIAEYLDETAAPRLHRSLIPHVQDVRIRQGSRCRAHGRRRWREGGDLNFSFYLFYN